MAQTATATRGRGRPKKDPNAPTESKRAKFVRLGNRRANRVLDALDSLGGLANPRAYEYSEEDVAAIMGAVMEAVRKCEARFSQPVKRGKEAAVLIK